MIARLVATPTWTATAKATRWVRSLGGQLGVEDAQHEVSPIPFAPVGAVVGVALLQAFGHAQHGLIEPGAAAPNAAQLVLDSLRRSRQQLRDRLDECGQSS